MNNKPLFKTRPTPSRRAIFLYLVTYKHITMKNKHKILFGLTIIWANSHAQNNIGGTNSSASSNGKNPYTIGEIFVSGTTPNQNSSGTIGAYSAILLKTTNGILSVEEKDFEVYPNPAKNELNIKFKNSQSKNDVQLFDLSGKQVTTQKIENNQIDLSDLASGIYILKLNEQTTFKITKE